MALTTERPREAIGPMLRSWRERRRLSQQELSDLSAVSTRHLSRVENEKARPTPEMILHLAEHMDVPLQNRNDLLLAGGYAPRYGKSSLDDPELAVVMDGLRGLLDAHLPYPALLLDDYWDVVDSNGAVDILLAGAAPELLEPPVNVIRLCIHPKGLATRIVNFGQWTAHLQQQVRHRAERTGDPRHIALAAEVTEVTNGPDRNVVGRPGTTTTGPVVTLELSTMAGVLRFYSTSAQLTTPTDVTLDGLHLETFLPADAPTRRQLLSGART